MAACPNRWGAPGALHRCPDCGAVPGCYESGRLREHEAPDPPLRP